MGQEFLAGWGGKSRDERWDYAEVSCKEFSVDAGKMKIIAGVTVLSEYLGWKPRRSGYSL